VPFEFLINGTFLRTSLDDYLTTHGISAETTLDIEYVRAQLPPSTAASYQHDDWVSAVDVLSPSSPVGGWAAGSSPVTSSEARILSASYDGLLRLWDLSGNVIATSSASEAPALTSVTSLLSAKFLSPTSVVSAGFDSRVRIWDYTESNTGASSTFTPRVDFLAHAHAINSLAVHGPTSRILSGSADGSAALFSSKLSSSTPAAPAHLLPRLSTKRRKVAAPAVSVRTAGAILHLTGHTAPVTSVIFSPRDASVAYTVSSDRTLRTWDLETGASVATLTPCGPHTALSALAGMKALSLLAVGHVGRAIALVDPRAAGGQRSSQASLVGHKGAISAVAAAPEGSDYGLVSSSFDGTCRVWDVRSTRSALDGISGVGTGLEEGGKVGEASYVVRRAALGGEEGGSKGGKVFGVVWDHEVGIVSGGEDGQVQVDR